MNPTIEGTPVTKPQSPPQSIADMLNARFDTLTRAEKQLANSLLDNYPVSGLASITLAR